MCTLIALFGVRADYPLVLASNRDEFYARPATGPQRLLDEPLTVGGRDQQAGGTWMGVTREGFFVGVTNHRGYRPRRADARSRGELVLNLLSRGGAREAKAHLASEDARQYSEFNLMFGDAGQLWVAYGREGEPRIEVHAVEPGLHVLPNGKLNDPGFPKCERARGLLEPHLEAPWPELRTALRDTLADGHTIPMQAPADAPAAFSADLLRKLSALCVRTHDYGTRSSNLVALAPGRCASFEYAAGPPDSTPFEDVTGLLETA